MDKNDLIEYHSLDSSEKTSYGFIQGYTPAKYDYRHDNEIKKERTLFRKILCKIGIHRWFMNRYDDGQYVNVGVFCCVCDKEKTNG